MAQIGFRHFVIRSAFDDLNERVGSSGSDAAHVVSVSGDLDVAWKIIYLSIQARIAFKYNLGSGCPNGRHGKKS